MKSKTDTNTMHIYMNAKTDGSLQETVFSPADMTDIETMGAADAPVWIVTANSQAELEQLEQAKPNAIVLAWPVLSLRQHAFLPPEKMAVVIDRLHQQGIQVYVNALKMMMEEDLPAAHGLIDFCAAHHVDGLYIADEGYIPLAETDGIKDILIYQPETLVVNAMDANFYTGQGLQAVCLAHELSLAQVQNIAYQAKGLEVLVQGLYSWMYSRRPLIENYLAEIGKDYHTEGSYTLQEANRTGIMPVEQGAFGTMVYADVPLQSLAVIQELYKAGIRRFRIDTYLEDAGYGPAQLALYKEALQAKDPADFACSAQAEGRAVGSDRLWSSQTTLRKENGR